MNGRLFPALAFAVLFAPQPARSQCGPPIGTFPYTEDFEAGPAWTSGGTASDWAWGTPAHPTINSAGGGVNSWCVGGLTGSFYNLGQQSWIESPCFDMSSLQYPWISFKIFWEVERQYDGLVLQYSLNGGLTYANVGAYGDPVDCLNANWYNEDYVNNLTQANPRHGWSGRIGATQGSCSGGLGSAGWVVAKHCLTGLAGQPSVRFRFLFGAGTACNSYDGIGIDDVYIGEAPPNAASFTFTCTGSTVAFQSTSGQCPTAYAWDFGDPGSGAQNTATTATPSHTYPGAGTYPVTLTVSGPCNASSTIVVPVTVLGVSITAVDPVCTPTSGSCTAVVSGGSAPYSYVWSPGGQTTATITGLAAGTYDVAVSATGVCGATATATLVAAPAPLTLAVSTTDVSCSGGSDGGATVTPSGGAAPYAIQWTPGGQGGNSLVNVQAGSYTATVTDAAGCTADTAVSVGAPLPLVVTAMADATICSGSSTTLTATTTGGTGGSTFAWSPAGPVVAPSATTVFTVVATDANGCTSASDAVQITVAALPIPVVENSFPVGCAPWCVDLSSPSAGAAYAWDLGDGTTGQGQSLTHCFTVADAYDVSLTITDASGCQGTTTVPGLVLVQPVPQASFTASPAVALITEPTFTLTSTTSGADELLWHLGDPEGTLASGPYASITYPAVGCYTVRLVASTDAGCADSTEAVLCVEDEYALYVPNTFTPNGDAINDVFGIVTSVRTPKDFMLRVFDRWGAEVWSTTDRDASWTGDGVEQGVYAWTVELRDATGTPRKARGHVVLLR